MVDVQANNIGGAPARLIREAGGRPAHRFSSSCRAFHDRCSVKSHHTPPELLITKSLLGDDQAAV